MEEITKKCSHCQSDIPLKAKKCPNCQSDLRNWFNRHPILTIFGILFVFFFMIGIIGDGTKKEGYIQQANKTSQQEIQEEKVFKIGENVQIDGTEWKVLSAKNLGSKLTSTNQFIPSKTTTGKFIQVKFEVENISNDLKSVGNTGLIDTQNREYIAASDVSFWIPDEEELFLIDNINPSITKTYIEIFDVASNATGLKFRPGGVIVLKNIFIDLGI